MSTIKDSTRKIADVLAGQFELEGSSLTLKADAYATTLPEEITAKQAEAVHAHDRSFVSGFALAAGEKAVEVLADNKELAFVNASTPVGISNVEVTVHRTATVAAGIAKKGEEVPTKEVKGRASVKITTTSGAEVKRVKDHIASLGETKL